MQIIHGKHRALSFDDVLLVPSCSYIKSRAEVDLSWEIKGNTFKNPIISANMDTITGVEMLRKMRDLGGLGILHRNMSIDDVEGDLFLIIDENKPYAVSVGCLDRDKERIDLFIRTSKTHRYRNMILCVDIANGHSFNMTETLQYIRDVGFTNPIIAGNVCTPDAVATLLDTGADIVKVGVGPGSACITREETGVGYPQLEAVWRCAQAGPIIADGGIRKPGDAAKCLAVGAKAVMMGGAFAGTDMVPGWEHPEYSLGGLKLTKEYHRNNPYIEYRGSASKAAQEDAGCTPVSVEGVTHKVKRKPLGSTEAVVKRYCAGIRSACSYSNAKNLAEFYKNAKIVQVSPNSMSENGAHFNANLQP